LEPKIEKLKERFGSSIETLASVALNFVLAHDHVACVIPGFRNEKQAGCNVAAVQGSLSDEDVAFIRDLFLEI
jgi:aryl-alcohol dehydrogenase-like predicted oxidoreductase